MKCYIFLLVCCFFINGEEAATIDQPSEIIDILIVVDVDSLLRKYGNGSMFREQPRGISHEYAFMVSPKRYVRTGQASADLHVNASIGDTFRWYSTSEKNNLLHQVIVYKLKFNNTEIMSPATVNYITGAPCAKVSLLNTEEIVQSKCDYYYLSSNTKGTGTVSYEVSFAVYVRNRFSNEMELIGYYFWDPQITIK